MCLCVSIVVGVRDTGWVCMWKMVKDIQTANALHFQPEADTASQFLSLSLRAAVSLLNAMSLKTLPSDLGQMLWHNRLSRCLEIHISHWSASLASNCSTSKPASC